MKTEHPWSPQRSFVEASILGRFSSLIFRERNTVSIRVGIHSSYQPANEAPAAAASPLASLFIVHALIFPAINFLEELVLAKNAALRRRRVGSKKITCKKKRTKKVRMKTSPEKWQTGSPRPKAMQTESRWRVEPTLARSPAGFRAVESTTTPHASILDFPPRHRGTCTTVTTLRTEKHNLLSDGAQVRTRSGVNVCSGPQCLASHTRTRSL